MADESQKLALELFKRSQNILILPSSPIDGDSVGSAIALYTVLKKLGKEVTVIASDVVPEVFQFLPNITAITQKMSHSSDLIITLDTKDAEIANVKSEISNGKVNIIITPKNGKLSSEYISFNKSQSSYDLIVTVDCAELKQLRSFYEENTELFHQIPVINIDHHISNAHFGKINLVDIMASSTTELLLPLILSLQDEMKIELIDEDVATLLLTGIITDTGSFQNANTTPRAFGRAAELISLGARQQEIIQHVYKTKQLSQLKLWGRVLTKLQTDEKYKIVWSVVSQQDFRDTESTEDQTGDIIDELMTNAPGAEVIVLMKEKSDKSVSVSVRTTGPSVDASKIAEQFGGGGHSRAAGFMLTGMDIRDAEYKIIDYIKHFQDERGKGLTDEEIKPLIDVKELMDRASSAQKAVEMMPKAEVKMEPKVKTPSPKLRIKKPKFSKTPEAPAPAEQNENGVTYRFED